MLLDKIFVAVTGNAAAPAVYNSAVIFPGDVGNHYFKHAGKHIDDKVAQKACQKEDCAGGRGKQTAEAFLASVCGKRVCADILFFIQERVCRGAENAAQQKNIFGIRLGRSVLPAGDAPPGYVELLG